MNAELYPVVELRIFERYTTDANYRVELRVPGDRDFPPGALPGDLPERLRTCPDAATYGRALGAALFAPEALGLAYREVRSAYRDRPVRVRLQIDPLELHELRWESLYHPISGTWLPVTATMDTLFSRYVLADYWGQASPLYTRPLRMLVILSSPVDAAQYGLAPLDISAWRGVFDNFPDITPTYLASDTACPPTLANLRAALAEGYPLVHVVAHGVKGRAGTALYLEDATGHSRVAPAQELVEIFHLTHERPRFCFLAACESGAEASRAGFVALGPTLIAQAGVPAVVAMAERVGMKATQDLTAAFYAHLPEPRGIDGALQRARADLRAGEDWDVPVLFSRLPDNQLLGDPAELVERQRDIQNRYGRLGELERTAAGQGVARPEATAEISYERARIWAKLADYERLAGPELPPALADITGKVAASPSLKTADSSNEPLPPRQRGLIVLVGRGRPQEGQVWNPYQDAAWVAIQYHRGPAAAPVLEHCWLIATRGPEGSETQAQALAELCAAHQIIPHIEYVKPFVLTDTFVTVSRIYHKDAAAAHLDAAAIIADFTGGTKPMSAGMLLACARRWPLEYIEGRQVGLASAPRLLQLPEEV